MSNDLERANPDVIRDEWTSRIASLVSQVEAWAKTIGWDVRRLEKKVQGPEVGPYLAPALVFQEEFTRLLLDPISREFPGPDGVVDLYKMPALDDIATLYSSDGKWRIHHARLKHRAVATVGEAKAVPLTFESFQEIVGEIE